jgi:hypothetical protein
MAIAGTHEPRYSADECPCLYHAARRDQKESERERRDTPRRAKGERPGVLG